MKVGKGKGRSGVYGVLAEGAFGTSRVSGESLKRLEGWHTEVAWNGTMVGLAFTCCHLISPHNDITYVYSALFSVLYTSDPQPFATRDWFRGRHFFRGLGVGG